MTFAEIDALTLTEHFKFEMAYRLLGDTATLNSDNGIYADATIDPDSVSKPTLSQLEAEFEVYKQHLRDLEQARLDEIARVEDLVSRVKALPDTRTLFSLSHPGLPNPEAWIRDYILRAEPSVAESNMQLLESFVSQTQERVTEDQQRSAIAAKIEPRLHEQRNGQKILAHIRAILAEKNVTTQDTLTLMSNPNIKGIVDLLNTGSNETARDMIATLDLTGLIVNEDDRAVIVSYANDLIG